MNPKQSQPPSSGQNVSAFHVFIPAFIFILSLSGLFISNRMYLNTIIIIMVTVSVWLLVKWIQTLQSSNMSHLFFKAHSEKLKNIINEMSLELYRSSERYRMIQESANIGSWDWDIETGDLAWSDQIEPMFRHYVNEISRV